MIKYEYVFDGFRFTAMMVDMCKQRNKRLMWNADKPVILEKECFILNNENLLNNTLKYFRTVKKYVFRSPLWHRLADTL